MNQDPKDPKDPKDSKKPVPNGAEVPIALPLSSITADHEWNVRSGDYRTSDSDSGEGKGTLGIADSMEERGQDIPIVVRPHPKEKDHYLLVEGFRRFSAAEMLEKRGGRIKDLPRAHILCRIQELSEADAAMTNLANGGNRDNLKPADVAYGIARALRLGKTLDEIVRQTGFSKTYVSNLSQIANDLRFDKKLFERWRLGGLPLNTDEIILYILRPNVPLGKQAAVLQEILANKRIGPGRKPGRDWARSAEREAKDFGWKFGRAIHKGKIPDVSAQIDWEGIVRECFKLGYERSNTTIELARSDQVEKIARTAEQACTYALEGHETWGSKKEVYDRQKDRARQEKVEERSDEPKMPRGRRSVVGPAPEHEDHEVEEDEGGGHDDEDPSP